VPPASREQPKGVARALRARGTARSQLQRVFMFRTESRFKIIPLLIGLILFLNRVDRLYIRCYRMNIL